MAFDAGMMACVVYELNSKIAGAKVEKIFMPEKDEIHFVLRQGREDVRLVISAAPNNPRICITQSTKENPASPPMLCMLLRKHLVSGRLLSVTCPEFDRVACFEFESYDEMGFKSSKFIMAEIMGKHSNIIFLNKDKKIINSVRTVDFSISTARQVLPGMAYQPLPSRDKINPLDCTREEFYKAFENYKEDIPADKYILSVFSGFSSLISREIAVRAGGHDIDKLFSAFCEIVNAIRENKYAPCLIYENEASDAPFEYSFVFISQYGRKAIIKSCESASEVIDAFFVLRDKKDRIKQRSQDIFKLLGNAESRLLKKLDLQTAELAECEKMEEYRLFGDLITQDIYKIKRGDKLVRVIDYSKEDCPEVEIALDERLTPAQNAQYYYKKYARKKSARDMLTSQIEIAREELRYIDSVLDSLSRAETEKDLSELREELSSWGYGKRESKILKKKTVKVVPKPMEAISPNGYKIYIGKNNTQNDYLTITLAEKNDYWFHVKDFPGSHVVLVTDGDNDPPAEDFTVAAEFAALNSKASGANIAVDYTYIKNVKKPSGSKPGYVIYEKYWTAYVTPDRERLKKYLK